MYINAACCVPKQQQQWVIFFLHRTRARKKILSLFRSPRSCLSHNAQLTYIHIYIHINTRSLVTSSENPRPTETTTTRTTFVSREDYCRPIRALSKNNNPMLAERTVVSIFQLYLSLSCLTICTIVSVAFVCN